MKQIITIGTRKSLLALWQSNYIKSCLEKEYPNCEVRLQKIVTKGDKILDVPLSKIGGKGLFTKEIETALLDGEVDLAVHSLKDMPTKLPDGLCLTAITGAGYFQPAAKGAAVSQTTRFGYPGSAGQCGHPSAQAG